MLRKRLFLSLLFAVALSLIAPVLTTSVIWGDPEPEPDYCDLYPDHCEEEGGGGEPGGGSGETWDGYTDGRISPNQADYYTIYCHAGTDTIYVVRTNPQTETIKQIPLIDAISLPVGGEQALGDFMTMVRNSENTITIYGSNGNTPEPGSKAFSLSDCIAANGGEPAFEPPAREPVGGDDIPDDVPETEAERQQRRRQEADEKINFCIRELSSGELSAWLLPDCLNNVLNDYNDVLNGDEIISLIVMVFCLNIVAGVGILPIGIVVFLGWHRRWLRRQKTL